MERIGFIGLGIMGKPMARNLLKAGYPLTVYNRSDGPAEALVAEGAVAAASPQDVAADADIVVTIVTDTPDVQQVLLGESGAIHAITQDNIVIDMSTISPTATREMANIIRGKGASMLDAPVSGGEGGAIAGTLSIMVGGEEAVFNRCLPVFETLGKNIVHVGQSGAGQLTKLCNQIAVAVTNLAMSEALIFGAKAGLDLKKMQHAIQGGAAGSWQKALRLVLQEADRLKLSLPATGLVHHLFHALESRGGGDEGTQALVKVLEQLGGVEVKQEN